jgi:hypothetical protein
MSFISEMPPLPKHPFIALGGYQQTWNELPPPGHIGAFVVHGNDGSVFNIDDRMSEDQRELLGRFCTDIFREESRNTHITDSSWANLQAWITWTHKYGLQSQGDGT